MAAVWLFDLDTLEGLLLGSIVAVHRRRGDLRAAARLDAAPQAGAHARGRGRLQRPGRGAARDRLHRLDPEARLRRGRHGDPVRRGARASARRSASRSAGSRSRAFSARRLDSTGLYPVASLATAAIAFGAADALHGSGLPRRLRGRAGARLGARSPPSGRSRCSTRGSPGWRRSRCSSRSGCSSSRASSATSRSRGRRLRWCSCFVARPVAASSAPPSIASRRPERVVLGWAGLRGAVPVVLATFPVIDHVARVADVLQHRLLRGRHLDAAPGHDLRAAGQAPRRDHRPSRRCRARWPRPARSGGSAPRSWSSRSGPQYALVGHRVRELGLPRDALLSVIVRGEEAVLPRGSTRIEAGDRLHVVVRSEAARPTWSGVVERWETGPGRAAARRARPSCGLGRVQLAALGRRGGRRRGVSRGDRGRAGARAPAYAPRPPRRARLARPTGATRSPARRSRVGGPRQVQAYARRRLVRETDDTARAWWQEVIGALAR